MIKSYVTTDATKYTIRYAFDPLHGLIIRIDPIPAVVLPGSLILSTPKQNIILYCIPNQKTLLILTFLISRLTSEYISNYYVLTGVSSLITFVLQSMVKYAIIPERFTDREFVEHHDYTNKVLL